MSSNNTRDSFRDKWERNPLAFFDATLREDSETFRWILTRNGFESGFEFRNYLSKKKRILDAGCGNGRVSALLRAYSDPGQTEIVAVDTASAHVAKENLKEYRNIVVLEKDLLGDLMDLGKFDFIYCQEVLHHTEDPKRAFLNVCDVLSPEGEIAIYVYKRKSPVREYVDDFIRSRIAHLDYESAMKVCRQVTELGKRLSETGVKVYVPAVDVLEIQEGEYDLQRFIYHFFMKCFWNSDVTFEENVVVNYDWYHPENSSRHTVEEVRGWFDAAGLTIVHEHVDFYGITMRGVREARCICSQ